MKKFLLGVMFAALLLIPVGAQTAFAGNGICSTIFEPVCGVDGNTYENECEAEKAEVEVAHEGECIDIDVGGELIPIESTSLILAGAQTFSWMIPVILSVLGIGLFIVSRKSE